MEHLSGPSLLLLALAVSASAQSIADQPAFSASPQTLQQAFQKLKAEDNPVTVLFEEMQYSFDSNGRQTTTRHLIFKVWAKKDAEGWATIEESWAPWLENRPSIRARVITQSGRVHQLDPKTIADVPVNDSDGTYTDRRRLEAPLPAFEEGAVVEQEVVSKEVHSSPVAGALNYFFFGGSAPTMQTRIRIRAPQTLPVRFKVNLLPDAAISDQTSGGVRTISFDQGSMQPVTDPLPLLPSDQPRYPHVVFSTGSDWRSIAQSYASLVDEQINGFNARGVLPVFPANANREQKIQAIVDMLNKQVRYTGIEFSEAALVPRKPSEVLERKYGDCKDKSTLAVSLLRAAGIDAHVALLKSSAGSDIEPTLPSIAAFNHAIVYVPGTPDYWLDLTDPDLRLGVISPQNQGRNALIARATESGLTRTPELTAAENRVVETREFYLAELGRAKVTELSETFGTPDREYRGLFGGLEQKDLQEKLKGYVEWTYAQAKVARITAADPGDLTKPFQLKIEMEDVQRGSTGRTEAAVAIRLVQIVTQRLPEYFREEEQDEKEAKTPPKKPRSEDFAIAEPFSYEWRYIIHAPAGFKLRELPPAGEEKLGPGTLTMRFTRVDDLTVTGNLSFILPKRRLTAAEGLELRTSVLELGKRSALLVYFDQIGETHLASGRVKEALAEFAALRKLHPSESLHALQTARALLAAGAGKSARAEADRAVKLEPNSPQAYLQLAEVLKHDLVGRPMEKGFDRDGAIAAYRKVLELDPSDNETRANLAILLEYNQNAVRYGAGAALNDALTEYRKILDKLATLGIPYNYAIDLLRVGQLRELRDYLAKQPNDENVYALRICAETLLNGAAAGARQVAGVSGVQAQQRVLSSAAQTLIQLRQYEPAAVIMESAGAGTPNPAANANVIQVLRKTKRLEDVTQSISQPEDALRVFMARVLQIEAHPKDWTEPISRFMLEGDPNLDPMDARRALAAEIGRVRNSGFSIQVVTDLGLSAAQFVRDGSDDNGWVVRMMTPGSQAQVWYVIRENGNYRLLAGPGQFDSVARLVLELAGNGKLAQAKLWLDRVREELTGGNSDDPLAGSMFARFWAVQPKQEVDLTTIQTAAALLLSSQPIGIESTVKILEAAIKAAPSAARDYLSASLVEAYLTAKQYTKAKTAADALQTNLPNSPIAFSLALRATYHSGGKQEADRLYSAKITPFKTNVEALRTVREVAIAAGDASRAVEIGLEIMNSGRATSLDDNQLAWSELMSGNVTAETREHANRGMLLGGNQPTGLIHTLAAIQAELGQTAEARASLLQRMQMMGAEEPDDNDWYVFGRIAEQFGLNDEAATMYRRLSKPRLESQVPSSSYALAQRRLAAMGQ